MTQIGSKLPAVAGRAGGRIALSARSDDDRIGFDFLARFQLYAAYPPVLGQNLADTGVQTDFAAQPMQFAVKPAGNVACMVAFGKHSAAALYLELDTERFKHIHDAVIVQVTERRIQESGISDDIAHEFLILRHVRQIAATLAGDIDFLAQLFVSLEQCDRCTAAQRIHRCHHTGCAAADDYDVIHLSHFPFPDRRDTRPRCFPSVRSMPIPAAACTD